MTMIGCLLTGLGIFPFASIPLILVGGLLTW